MHLRPQCCRFFKFQTKVGRCCVILEAASSGKANYVVGSIRMVQHGETCKPDNRPFLAILSRQWQDKVSKLLRNSPLALLFVTLVSKFTLASLYL